MKHVVWGFFLGASLMFGLMSDHEHKAVQAAEARARRQWDQGKVGNMLWRSMRETFEASKLIEDNGGEKMDATAESAVEIQLGQAEAYRRQAIVEARGK